jgi:ferric-chelate reductase
MTTDKEAGFVVWGFDRFVGLCRMAIINKVWLMPLGKKHNKQCSECTVELVTSDIVRLTVPRPLLRWGPGQHA